MNQLIRQAQSKKGFSQVILLGIVAVLVLAGSGGFLVFREKKLLSSEKTVQQEVSFEDVTSSIALGNLCSGEKECISFCLNNRGRCEKYCNGNKNELCKTIFPAERSVTDIVAERSATDVINERVTEACSSPRFTHYIVDPKFLKSITQIGGVGGGNTEMVGRSYIFIREELASQKIPLYAPTDMRIIGMSYYIDPAIPIEQRESANKDYAMAFDAGCGVTVSLAHIKELASPLKEISPPLSTSSAHVQVKQVLLKGGDLIGYYLKKDSYSRGFDFVMNDQRVINQFVNQKRYESSSRAYNYHSVCPYDYYQGEMKEAYYELLPGKNCGTMEHDKIGTISGQWFLNPNPATGIGGVIFGRTAGYGNPLPIVKMPDRITVGNIGSSNVIWIYPNSPTYKDPKEITTEHCYQNYPMNPDTPQGYIYFKVVDNMTLDAYFSETGNCPSIFPSTGGKRYYR